jgi:hypothetical protein
MIFIIISIYILFIIIVYAINHLFPVTLRLSIYLYKLWDVLSLVLTVILVISININISNDFNLLDITL